MPADAIPDVFPMIGYVDDAAVIAWVAKRLAVEIAAFRAHARKPASSAGG